MARTEVNARWQAAMAELFQSEGAPDEAWEIIPEVFNLEDQLRGSGVTEVMLVNGPDAGGRVEWRWRPLRLRTRRV